MRGFNLVELAIVLVLIGVLIGVFLKLVEDRTPEGKRAREARHFEERLLRDPKTGCEYIRDYEGRITPRLNQRGEPMCGQ